VTRSKNSKFDSLSSYNMRVKCLWSIGVSIIVMVVTSCAVGVGGKDLPQANVNFQPREVYDVSYEEMWNIVTGVLETERIGIISTDKENGRILTDYIQGKETVIILFDVSAVATRYKYNISFMQVAPNKTKVFILASIEMQAEDDRFAHDWRDISKDNEKDVKQLENWLYEKIENAIIR